jgi:hypothetical protein
MADIGAPISIGMKILEKGKALALRSDNKELAAKFDKSIAELSEYIKKGHTTLDDDADRIVFAPFSVVGHEFQEEAMSGIKDDSTVVPKKPGHGKK